MEGLFGALGAESCSKVLSVSEVEGGAKWGLHVVRCMSPRLPSYIQGKKREVPGSEEGWETPPMEKQTVSPPPAMPAFSLKVVGPRFQVKSVQFSGKLSCPRFVIAPSLITRKTAQAITLCG